MGPGNPLTMPKAKKAASTDFTGTSEPQPPRRAPAMAAAAAAPAPPQRPPLLTPGSIFYRGGPDGTAQVRVAVPHAHDVLSGRGGSVNSHRGNIRFREWVRARKNDYNLVTNKHEKARIAGEVIALVRNQRPPGRFLHRDAASGPGLGWWLELDDERVLAKTAQALREGAPQIRALYKGERGTARQRKKRSMRQLNQPAAAVPPSWEDSVPTASIPDAPSSMDAAEVQHQLPFDVFSEPSFIPSELEPQAFKVPVAKSTLSSNIAALRNVASDQQPAKSVLVDYNGAMVRPNDETPPLLPLHADQLLLPPLSLPPPSLRNNGTGHLPRTHSLALSDISVGANWANEEFVDPFASESDVACSNHSGSGDAARLRREISSSSSLSQSAPPKPAQFIITSDLRSSESHGDMGGIGALLRESRNDLGSSSINNNNSNNNNNEKDTTASGARKESNGVRATRRDRGKCSSSPALSARSHGRHRRRPMGAPPPLFPNLLHGWPPPDTDFDRGVWAIWDAVRGDDGTEREGEEYDDDQEVKVSGPLAPAAVPRRTAAAPFLRAASSGCLPGVEARQ